MIDRTEKNKKIKDSMIETFERRKNQSCKVFKVKVQFNSLSKAQQEQLKMMFVEAKWLVNDILRWSEDPNNKPWNYKLSKTVQVKKNDSFETRVFSFLSVAERQAVQSEVISNIRTLSTLKKKGLKVGRLKFRSEVKEINLKQVGKTHKIISSKRMKIQGVSGKIIVNGLKQLPKDFEMANAKLLNTARGYYIAITCFVKKEIKNPSFKPEIGIDMGIKTAITTSEGQKIDACVEETVRLKKLQKKFSKQTSNFTRNTNNSRKTQLLIKREYEKITNRKNDVANKIVHDLLEHEKVYIQDENLKAWKHLFGKKVQHSVLGRVKAKLVQHPRVVVLDKFVPTTQSCHCVTLTKHALSEREFKCSSCGFSEDRDIHAAKNMIRLGKDVNIKKKKVGQELIEFTPMDIESLALQALSDDLNSVEEVGRCRPLGRH